MVVLSSPFLQALYLHTRLHSLEPAANHFVRIKSVDFQNPGQVFDSLNVIVDGIKWVDPYFYFQFIRVQIFRARQILDLDLVGQALLDIRVKWVAAQTE